METTIVPIIRRPELRNQRTKMPGITVNLGGEGEIPNAVNVNLPCITRDSFRLSRDGALTFSDIKKSGPVVICDSDKLPFKDKSVNVVCNGSPVGDFCTHLGPAYPLREIERIATPQSYKRFVMDRIRSALMGMPLVSSLQRSVTVGKVPPHTILRERVARMETAQSAGR